MKYLVKVLNESMYFNINTIFGRSGSAFAAKDLFNQAIIYLKSNVLNAVFFPIMEPLIKDYIN